MRQTRRLQRDTVIQGSLLGMRDTPDPTAGVSRKAFYLQNVYPDTSGLSGSTKGRPGIRRFALSPTGRIQGFAQFTRNNGVAYSLVFRGGQMRVIDWATRSTTNIPLGAGAVLNNVSKVYTVTFANRLIVSDGVNKPFTWDGTTFEVLTNAPVFFGQPVVYFARLFGINSDARHEIQWSEPNQPATGYAVGGYNNAWELTQVTQGPISRLWSTEQALYFARPRAASFIAGRVTDQFQTTGTRSGLSDTIGVPPRGPVVLTQKSMMFLDADAKPQKVMIGGGVVEEPAVWEDAAATVKTLDPLSLPNTHGVFFSPLNLILFTAWTKNQVQQMTTDSDPDRILVFDAATGQFLAIWTGIPAYSMAILDDGAGPVVMFGSHEGRIYQLGRDTGTWWSDEQSDGSFTPIEHVVEGAPVGYDISVLKEFERIDLSLEPQAMTGVTVSLHGTAGSQAIQTTVPKQAVTEEFHRPFGFNLQSRWARPRIRHAGLNEKFGFLAWNVDFAYLEKPPRTK